MEVCLQTGNMARGDKESERRCRQDQTGHLGARFHGSSGLVAHLCARTELGDIRFILLTSLLYCPENAPTQSDWIGSSHKDSLPHSEPFGANSGPAKWVKVRALARQSVCPRCGAQADCHDEAQAAPRCPAGTLLKMSLQGTKWPPRGITAPFFPRR